VHANIVVGKSLPQGCHLRLVTNALAARIDDNGVARCSSRTSKGTKPYTSGSTTGKFEEAPARNTRRGIVIMNASRHTVTAMRFVMNTSTV
jgi:hypothetical protein